MKKGLFITLMIIFFMAALQTYCLASNPCTFGIDDGFEKLTHFTVTAGASPIVHTYIYTSINANFELIRSFVSSGVLAVGVSSTIIPGKTVTLSSISPPLGIEWANYMIEIIHAPGISTGENWDLRFHLNVGLPATLQVYIGNTDAYGYVTGTGDITLCPPILDPIGNQSMNEGENLVIDISSADSGTIMLDFLGLPSFCDPNDFGDGTGYIECNPGFGDAGPYSITVKTMLFDEPDLYNSETFLLDVINVNRPPELAPIGDQSMHKETILSIPLSATDPDDDPLTYSFPGLPSFCDPNDFGDGNAVIDCAPTNATPSGEYIITVRVSDSEDFDEEIFTLTVLRKPMDIVFVLDSSGSMNDQDKFVRMVEATQLLFDLYSSLQIQDTDDRWDIVFFRCLAGPDHTPAYSPDLLPVSLPPQDIRNYIYTNFTPLDYYLTPIAEGVEKAIDLFGDLSTPRERIILLLSDGMETCGPELLDANTQDALTDGNITVHSVGVGEGFEIEAYKIQQTAANTGGEYHETTDPNALDTIFSEILCELTEKERTVVDASGNVIINTYTTKAIFILTWSDTTEPLEFHLMHPNGEIITPSSWPAGLDLEYIHRDSHTYYILEDNDPLGGIQLAEEGLDTWSYSVIYQEYTYNFETNTYVPPTQPAQMIAIEDLSLRVKFNATPKIPYTSDPIILTAEIKEAGMPVLDADVYADVNGPIESPNYFLTTGIQYFTMPYIISSYPLSYQYLSQQSAMPAYQYVPGAVAAGVSVPPDRILMQNLLTDIVTPLDLTPRNFVLDRLFDFNGIAYFDEYSMRVRLHDDGINGDLVADDGIYTYVFTNTYNEGTYQFDFTAKGFDSIGGRFARIKTLTRYVLLKPDPEISTSSTTIKITGSTVQAKIIITPKDLNGISLGQFNKDRIELKLSAGKLVDFYDNLDGSYVAIIEFNKDMYGPTVTPVVSGISLRPIRIDYTPKRDLYKLFCFCYCYPSPFNYTGLFYSHYLMNLVASPAINYSPQLMLNQPVMGSIYNMGLNRTILSYGPGMGVGIPGVSIGNYYGSNPFGGYPVSIPNTLNYYLNRGFYPGYLSGF